jgi:hypothetical protein
MSSFVFFKGLWRRYRLAWDMSEMGGEAFFLLIIALGILTFWVHACLVNFGSF